MKLRHLAVAVLAIVVLLVVVLIGRAWLTPAGAEPQSPVAGAPVDLPQTVSQGEYLAKAADCVACHTAVNGIPYAGGRAFQLPFGTLYATNLTPDRESGIGSWTDDEFVRAVRDGIGRKGHLYPAMPYTSYTALSRADILAIKQYLFTLKPVHQPAPASGLSFPFNQRWGMTLWNLAFFHEQRFAPEPTKAAEWNRGAYLATALGHCGECHTPRNIGLAMRSHDYLSGTVVQGWKAYNTTSDQQYGLGNWSDEQIQDFLWHGHAPGRSTATGPMAEVVENSLQYFTASDMTALVAYLRAVSPAASGNPQDEINLKPKATVESNAVLPASNEAVASQRGKQLFAGVCIGCHQFNGEGRQSDYANLTGSHAVNDPAGTALVQVLVHGSTLKVGATVQTMPAFGDTFSDADIAALANYVLEHFGSKQGTVTAAQVAAQRKQN